MTKWCTRPTAVRWILMFLLTTPSLARYTETTTEYPETTTEPIAPNTEATEDPRRSERMVVVYSKSDPKAQTKNITQFLDSDDLVYTTGDNETIIITDSEEGEDELIHDDGDLMVMAGRSLNDNTPSEAEAFETKKQSNSINREFNLRDVLNKWSNDVDFNLSELLKVNLASLLADDYEEMNRLMNQNLVEDTDEFRDATVADGFEPRDVDDGKLDTDQTVAASSEVVQQVLPVPASTLPRQMLRSSGQIVPQYTYPLYAPMQRSDSVPSYIFLPKVGNSQTMALLPTGSAMRSPVPSQTLPRTVAQRMQATTIALSRLIPRPQTAPSEQTTPRSPSRFGDRFVSRLPRPFQYMLNMTVGSRQTTSERPLQTFRPSTVSQSPPPSLSSLARQRAPSRYFQGATTRNNLPPPTRLQGAVATTESRTTRPRITTAAPISTEFGARIRSFRYEKEKNSTNITQNANKTKVNREVKINHLRSNLVGKLVVMQSILDEKQEKSGNAIEGVGKLAATRLNREGLPNGILKPIVPLRPRVNFETITTPKSLTETEKVPVPVTTTDFGLKDKKKYRRPPSFRKGGSYKLSAEKQTDNGVTSNPAKLRESMVILQVETTPSSIENTTEKSGQSSDISSLQTSPLPATRMSDANENSTDITNNIDTTTTDDSADSATTSETEIMTESVETTPAANTTELSIDLQGSTLVLTETAQYATETARPRDNVNNNGQTTPFSTIEPDTSLTIVDLQGTSVENTTETVIKNEKSLTSSILDMVDTSLPQETTTVETVENGREAQSIKSDEEWVSTTIPELAFTLLKDATLSAETTTESSSTYVPQEDHPMKAVFERTYEDTESRASSENQKEIVSADNFVDDESPDDEGDDEPAFNFPDVESDSVIETNDELLSIDKLSRFDRSVGVVSNESSNKAVDTLVPYPIQITSPVLGLARGVMRPIKLPYNILPANETITR